MSPKVSKKPVVSAKKPAAAAPSTMPIRQLDELAAWLAKAPVNEVEVEQKGLRLRLSKSASAPAAAYAPPAPAAGAAPAPVNAQPAENAANIFKSPMVGTFYRSASPEAQPFVKVGDTVQSGQTLCIIEAMKTMNQITSDRSGKVTKILVENTNPVEFGQPLFVIE